VCLPKVDETGGRIGKGEGTLNGPRSLEISRVGGFAT
jgi:hypothetical protein